MPQSSRRGKRASPHQAYMRLTSAFPEGCRPPGRPHSKSAKGRCPQAAALPSRQPRELPAARQLHAAERQGLHHSIVVRFARVAHSRCRLRRPVHCALGLDARIAHWIPSSRALYALDRRCACCRIRRFCAIRWSFLRLRIGGLKRTLRIRLAPCSLMRGQHHVMCQQVLGCSRGPRNCGAPGGERSIARDEPSPGEPIRSATLVPNRLAAKVLEHMAALGGELAPSVANEDSSGRFPLGLPIWAAP